MTDMPSLSPDFIAAVRERHTAYMDAINLDRGTHGDEGHFVTIEGHAVFIPDDAPGTRGHYTKHGIEERLVAHHKERGGDWAREHRETMAEGTGHDLQGSSHFTFHKRLPAEVRHHIENNPATRRIFRVTNDAGAAKGADAMASMGDRYWRVADDAAGSRLKDAKAMAHKSDDPTIRFDAAMHDAIKPGAEKKRLGLMPAHELDEGHEFTIHGLPVKVVDGGDDGLVLQSDHFPRVPVAAFDSVPIDQHSLKHPTLAGAKYGDVIPFSMDTLYLSTESALKPTRSAKLPERVGDLPAHYFWADALIAGDYSHPATKQAVNLSTDRLDRLCETFRDMKARGVSVPIIKDHKRDSDSSLGFIVDAKRDGDRLMLLHQFIGDDAKAIGLRNRISVGLKKNFTDAKGKTYPDAIEHSATTPFPVIPNQQGFTEAVFLSLVQPQEYTMLNDELKARVAKTLGTDSPNDANEAVTVLLSRIDTLTADAAAKDEKLTQLSADAVKPAPATKAEKENVALRLDLSVSSGDMPKFFADKLKSKLTDDSVLLSRDGAGEDAPLAVAAVIDLFKDAGLGKSSKERTGVQTLSRDVPDGGTQAAEPVNPYAATIARLAK